MGVQDDGGELHSGVPGSVCVRRRAAVMVTAHVGPNRVLVMPGDAGFGGVTIDAAMTVVRVTTSDTPEMLLHVIPQAGATWLKGSGALGAPTLGGNGSEQGQAVRAPPPSPPLLSGTDRSLVFTVSHAWLDHRPQYPGCSLPPVHCILRL